MALRALEAEREARALAERRLEAEKRATERLQRRFVLHDEIALTAADVSADLVVYHCRTESKTTRNLAATALQVCRDVKTAVLLNMCRGYRSILKN